MKKVDFKCKFMSVLLVFVMLVALMGTTFQVHAIDTNSGAVGSDSANFDVFMNVDPSYGVEADELSKKVGNYLQQQIDEDKIHTGTDRNYRINTTSVQIDPTDLTKWEVYDHYDTAWYANESVWKSNYNGRNIVEGQSLPENWYWSGVSDSSTNATINGKTTIDKIENWGTVAQLREHIYTKVTNNKPAMQFYGYGQQAYADFLYYPATNTSTKKLKFDIDASNVRLHSMKYSGFLINAGTTGTGTNKKINGYLVVFAYSGGTGQSDVATGLTNVYLINLNNMSVDSLHTSGISTTGTAASNRPFYKKSHIEMDIKSDRLVATIQKLNDDGSIDTGAPAQELFDTALNDTGYGGFGPYVQYTSHNCSITSSFEFSNLEMSFKEPVGTSSPLEPYKYADYLKNSDNRFFINLTQKDITNYDLPGKETEIDKGYLKQIQDKKAVLITDEGTQTKNSIFPENYLGVNTKNTFDPLDVSNDNIKDLYNGSDETEILAAKLAWLIFNTKWDDSSGSVANPQDALVGDIKLMDGKEFDSSNQVNSIYKEYISDINNLKVYPNIKGSTNYNSTTDKPTYKLTYPDKKTVKTVSLDGDGAFTIDKSATWPIGDYILEVEFTSTNPSKTVLIGAATSFSINTDAVAPELSTVSFNNSKATLTFKNTESAGNNTYTSPIESYGYVVTNSTTQPSEATYTQFTDQSQLTIANVNLGDSLSSGTHYLFTFVKDEAGNKKVQYNAFTINAPTVAFKENMTGNSTSNRYEGDKVTLLETAGSYDIEKVELWQSNTNTWKKVTSNSDGDYIYELPHGSYQIKAKVTDSAGNESQIISAYVDTKKMQKLIGTKVYNMELGIDTGAQFDIEAFDKDDDTPLNTTISYQVTADTSGAISLNNDSFMIHKVGQATVVVTSSSLTEYREATDSIVVNVKNPLSVKLNAVVTANGVKVNPSYEEGYYGVSNDAVLKYREKGSSSWHQIADDQWNWNQDYLFEFTDLKDYVEYEFAIEAKDNRPSTPHSDVSTFTHRTPDEKPQFNISDLQDGIKGVEYNDQILADGTHPLTFDVIDGDFPDGLILDSTTGEITGTPTKPGDFTFTVEVKNAAGNKVEKEFTITIANPPTITTDQLNPTIIGELYNQTLVAEGDADIKWSITKGELPDGLVLNSDTGQISGTTLESGSFEFTITATNQSGTDSKDISIFVAQPPIITTPSLNNTIVGTEYKQTVEAIGDKKIIWSIVTVKSRSASYKRLPDGLSLDIDTGEITGTTTLPGTYTFILKAANNAGSDIHEYTIFVAEPPKIITTDIVNTVKATPYHIQLEATGDQPISWAISSGQLPKGIILNQKTGTLEGTAIENGNFTFTITASNNSGIDQKTYHLFVANPPAIEEEQVMPEVGPGKDFEYTIDADGDGPFYWEVIEGELPDGLVLDSETGKITGKPTKPGDYTFVIEVTNSVGTARKEITISIPYPPAIIKQPKNQVVEENQKAIFEVNVIGEGPMTYQWQINQGDGWKNVDGANSNAYSFIVMMKDNNAKFRCLITNKANTIMSNEATLTVKSSNQPQTSDTTHLTSLLFLMVISFGYIAIRINKRNNNKV